MKELKNKVIQVVNIVDDTNIGFKNPQRGRVYSIDGLAPAIYCFQGGNLEPKIVETKYMCMKEPKNDTQIIQAGTIVYPDHSGEHQQDFVQHADGISRVIPAGTHASTPHLLKTYIPMTDKNAINLPKELEGKKFRIRKLTMRECFRLMDVDDKDIDKIQAAKISNSAQYKLAGNSIVVNVLYHLFRKMFIEKENENTQRSLF